jgi:hypothetical protein
MKPVNPGGKGKKRQQLKICRKDPSPIPPKNYLILVIFKILPAHPQSARMVTKLNPPLILQPNLQKKDSTNSPISKLIPI